MNQRLGKYLYMLIGYVAVMLAIIGMFLPLMPTTCFLILAVWAFSRSAPEKAQQILMHPRFGTTVNNWYQYRIITRRTKNIITLSILTTFSITLFIYRDTYMVCTILVTVMLLLLAYINTRSETPFSDTALSEDRSVSQ